MKHLEHFTDRNLAWDEDNGFYVLTKEYVRRNYDVTYRDDGILDRRLLKNSRIVYQEIKKRLASANMKFGLWLINETAEGRKFVFDILCAQMEADLTSAYNDIGNSSPVNMANGHVMKREELMRNVLCVNAETIIDAPSAYFPFNIFMSWEYPANVRALIYGFFR